MKTLVMMVFAVVTPGAFATAQYPDKIIFEGKEYDLLTNPMEPYFADHPDRKPKSSFWSSGLLRGYVATFEFKADLLVLKDIQIEIGNGMEGEKFDTSWKSVKEEVLPQGKDLSIDWFTGILVLPHGELVNYVHLGYGSTYSDYILLELKKGKLTGKRTLDGREYVTFKEKQFQAFKKTEEYKKRAEDLKREDWSQDKIDSFLRDFVVGYSSAFLDEVERGNPARKQTAEAVD